MKLRIRGHRHAFGLWIPLFIIGPIALIFLLALFLIALPFVLISMFFTWRWGYWRYAAFSVPAFFRIICALPGLKVDVEDGAQHILVAFY
jgi:hypothetical protein